jgi:hypothetical protein
MFYGYGILNNHVPTLKATAMGGGSIPYVPLLDTYSGAVGAYSLRKLRTAYSGSCIRVRRSSDNTSQDIGFVNNILDTTSLLSFVGSNNGFVSIFYDQSGNSYNFAQSTSDYQPQIVSSGSVLTKNSKPTMVFDGTSDYMEVLTSSTYFNFLHKTGQAFVSAIAYNRIADESIFLANNYGSSGNTGYGLYSNTINNVTSLVTRGVSGQATSSNSSITAPLPVNSLFMLNNELDNGNATASLRSNMYINNGSAISLNILTNSPSTADATYPLFLGVAGGSTRYGFLDGGISEVLLFNSNQSSNRVGISTNINSFYSIY